MSEREQPSRTPHVLAAMGLVLVTAVLVLRRLDDWDLPWHLATGRIVATTRAIPRIDDLAFTRGVLKYTEVVSDVALYGVIRAFGPFGLQVVNGIVTAATLLTLQRTMRAAGALAYVVLGVVIVTIAPWQYVRPATISLWFIAAVFLIVERHRALGRGLFLLVPLQLVWANVHGYAPIGVMLAWLYALEVRKRETVLAALLSTLATMCSTAGPRLLVMVKRFDEDLVGISEWARPTPSMLWKVSPAVYLLLALLLVALVVGRERVRLFDVGSLLIAAGLFVTAIRFVPVFAVMVAPFLARRLPLARTRMTQLACGLAALVPAFAIELALEPLLGIGWYWPHFPEGATQYIEAHKPAGNMWNFMPFGGYLAWRLHPNVRVFNDGRNALARDRSIVTRGRLSVADSAEFEFLVRDFNMQWAVTCTIAAYCKGMNQPLAQKHGWRMVFVDDTAAVYARTDGPNAPLARDGYRVLHHLMGAADALALPGERAADLAHDGALAVSQAPYSVRAHTFRAIGALAVRDEPAFRAALERIEQLAPGAEVLPVLRSAWR